MREAAEIANALEFVESSHVGEGFDENPAALRKGLEEHREEILAAKLMTEEEYNSALKLVTQKAEKDEQQFLCIRDIFDTRDEA